MSLKKRKPPVVLSIEEVAKRANAVVADVDELVAQIKMMVEEHRGNNNGK